MRIRDHPTAPRSPGQNGYIERLIGSIRSECLDHVVVFGEADLRRVLKAYASYYNQVRTHLSTGQGRTTFQTQPHDWQHRGDPYPWRTTPPISPALRFSVRTGRLDSPR